ncbi:MAG: IS4 family transposase [Verrucomicrobiales bacterium]|nr:IS4 family transposase [Verrucomicrobiales bacterium]
MNAGKLVFAQLVEPIHPEQFRRCVRRYRGEYKVKSFACWDQFLCMAFGQLTFRESLRDVEVCLRSREEQLYHVGIRGHVSHSTLADANRVRDWRIYADLAQILIRQARILYQQEPIGMELEETVYALDSTTIDLCLNLFPWARFRRHKAAVKLHTLLDIRGSIPTFIAISQGKQADIRVLDVLLLEPGAFYVMDRAYVDFKRLYAFVLAGAFFVTRSKRRIRFSRVEARPVDYPAGVRYDQIVRLKRGSSRRDYPDKLRRIRYYDEETRRDLVFLTNNLSLPAIVIAFLYKCRWRVELFFKWIKQNLRIKHFYGTSDNAVKTQVWISVCVYVLVAILRKRVGAERSLSEIIQILSVNAFEKVPLHELLTDSSNKTTTPHFSNQLMLWD